MDAHDDMAFSYAKPQGVPKVFKMREEKVEPTPIKKPVKRRRKRRTKKQSK